MGVRHVSESEMKYKFHLYFLFPSGSVKSDVRLVVISIDISIDSHKTSIRLSCDKMTRKVLIKICLNNNKNHLPFAAIIPHKRS